jgi:hypothetical protein
VRRASLLAAALSACQPAGLIRFDRDGALGPGDRGIEDSRPIGVYPDAEADGGSPPDCTDAGAECNPACAPAGDSDRC